jgi:YbbR domain-containing protein
VKPRDFVRRHVLHNIGLKLTSLILATGLWLAVESSPESEVGLNVAVIFRNMPADLEISSESVPSVQIRVRGPERIVRRLQASDVHEEIDMSGVKPGEHTFDLTKAAGVPDRLQIAQVIPSEAHVLIDVRATRQVPVQPRIEGQAASGYRVAEFRSEPASVEVIGPKKQVDAVASATTDPVDISGATGTVSVTRPAYVSDPLIQVSNPQPVRVTITIQKETPASQTQ